jgi:polysaccharide biosynthesis/export protein
VVSSNGRWANRFVLALAVGAVASCGLPRTGPTKQEIYSGSVQRQGDAFVVTVDDYVTRTTAVVPALGFDADFQNAGVVGSDTVQPGDTLSLQIWENVETGLLTSTGQGATVLEEVQVDGEGFIFVPYAGRLRAAGNSTEAIRRLITERLAEQTPDPQVLVRRVAGDGATVSLVGAVGAQGVYPLDRPARTLTAMLARAGGVTVKTDIAQVVVTRGNRQGRVWLQDLYADPSLDIALRAGDRILVEGDTRSFTALGATGAQNRVLFDSQTISGLEAIARVGGLNPGLADPTGVFVFRNEPQEIASALLGRNDLVGDQRIVYVLDLTQANGMFIARDFAIRDGDTVYVTEAPYAQFSKLIGALTGPLSTAGAISNLSNLTN